MDVDLGETCQREAGEWDGAEIRVVRRFDDVGAPPIVIDGGPLPVELARCCLPVVQHIG